MRANCVEVEESFLGLGMEGPTLPALYAASVGSCLISNVSALAFTNMGSSEVISKAAVVQEKYEISAKDGKLMQTTFDTVTKERVKCLPLQRYHNQPFYSPVTIRFLTSLT